MGLSTDAVVIGAGIVGLAVARELSRRGLEVIVLEKASGIGEETSSRNSEVIHAGIYYPRGSLKARTCVRGKKLLYRFLQTHQVPFSRCGKIVVAGSEKDRPRLEQIKSGADHCGVTDLRGLDAVDLNALEPLVKGEMGLYSPSTGIVDAHQLMLAIQGELESAGGALAFTTPVESGRLSRSGDHIVRVGGESPVELSCRLLVNAAGLHAGDVWSRFEHDTEPAKIPAQYFAKGHYYTYSGSSPFSHLVYPLPEPGGLGIHATLDLGGQVRFGPDVRWTDTIDYAFDESVKGDFVRVIKRYFPGLDETRLQPGYTGIRPKIVGPGKENGDFAILGPAHHRIPGFCSLHGIESPGLTASLAIAEEVAATLFHSEYSR